MKIPKNCAKITPLNLEVELRTPTSPLRFPCEYLDEVLIKLMHFLRSS